jgi:hypothetical protein
MLRDRPPAKENRQSCLRQEEGPFFLSKGTLFLPIVVSRWAKNCNPPCLRGEIFLVILR